MTAPVKTNPPITEEEVHAYQHFSKECAKVEKQLYGSTVFQDSRVRSVLGETKNEWAQTFEFLLTIKRIFDNEGVEKFLTKVAPKLVSALVAVEAKTDTFLTLARALINGMGWGTVPIPIPPPSGVTVSESSPIPERLLLMPCVVPTTPEFVPPPTTTTPAATPTTTTTIPVPRPPSPPIVM